MQSVEADSRARALSHQRSTDRMYDVDERVDRLTLACQAMWELLQETLQLDDDALRKRIDEIDGRDGRLDGFHRPGADQCACGAAVAAGSPRCQFCGEEAPDRSPFKEV